MTTATRNEHQAYQGIGVERQPPAAIITINRPEALNALNNAVFSDLTAALDELESDDQIRAVIITGSGGKAFSAGADIGELQAHETAEQGYAHSRRSHQLLFKMQGFPKPIIMAVNGYALGGGMELVMAGDIILASENAKFGQPEVNLGIIPGFGGTQRLPRLVGRIKSLELIFTGEMIDAAEAHRIGLINRVIPAERLLDEAQALVATIAKKAPLAITLAKRAVYEGLESGPRAGSELEMTYFGLAIGTEDRKEGTSAFLEKRQPQWRNK